MTETAFPELTQAQKIAKSIGWDVGVKAGLTSLGLNFWPLNAVLIYITDRIWGQLRLGMDLAAISFVNAQHEKAFNNAYANLRIVASHYGIESKEFQEARKNAQDTLVKFSHYGAV